MNENFCQAPWLSVYVDPAGAVENCCVSKNSLGNVNSENIRDLVKQGKNYQIQQSMLNDQSVQGCSWCQGRSHTLRGRFDSLFPDHQDPLYQNPGQFELRYLDLRWSNVCNYACVYCSPTLSSAWATELGETHLIQRETKKELLTWVLEQIENIQHIYMAGGEPTMMRENEVILEAIRDRNPDCKILINTNLSHAQSSRVFEIGKDLVNCSWMVSMEDRADRYDYIRYPGKWGEFSQNLTRLQNQVPALAIAFNMVFLNLNALTMWDTVDELLERGFDPDGITLSLYNNGTIAGPWDMIHTTKNYQTAVCDRMNRDRYQDLIGWQNIREYLLGLGDCNDPTAMLQQLRTLDQRRRLDSRKTFPLVYQFIDT